MVCRQKKVSVPMNLKSVSDLDLLRDTKHYANQEKENGIKVLHHLREIDARKLFAPNYSTLFNYCLGELGYSEGSAARRIQTMRLLRDIPEYENKLHDGSTNESNLSAAQTFFNREKKKKGKSYSKEQKLEVLKEMEGKSTREAQQALAAISPESARRDHTKPINAEETEIRFTANKALMEKLEKIRNLLGHKLSDQQFASLFEELADIALKKLEPEKDVSPALAKVSETRYIPAKVKRAVWHRDKAQCTHVDSKNKRCTSKHALQYEHIIPFAKGGKTSVENLKLLCRAHNQIAAIQAYGLTKMREFWRN
jgi:hypothetical protein